jgi:hypothetical protein
MFARFRVYEKIEVLLSSLGELAPLHKQLLAKRFYETLRCFARFEPNQCPQLMKKIYSLDPHFVVDATCEPEAWALWVIRRIGLRSFLRGYGAVRRLGDAANPLSKP